MQDLARYKPVWTIRKYEDDRAYAADLPFAVAEFEGNLLLNEGITALQALLIGNAATVFSNTNARLGVGDSTTAAVATQVDLQAATNKLYKGMAATYPQVAGQTTTWRAVFASADANYAWQEFSVDNGATAAINLNRKVAVQGTKVSGQTWTLDLAITWS